MTAVFRGLAGTLFLAAAAQFLFASAASAQSAKLLEPKPILEGDKVVTLFPPGHPALKQLDGYDQPEKFNLSKGANPHVLNITNIHNPSIELQLPPPAKANGTAIIVAAGGGNTTLWVGPEGAEIGKWLNGLGVAAFNERYRLKPYDSAVDALADTQRSVRMVRACEGMGRRSEENRRDGLFRRRRAGGTHRTEFRRRQA